MGSRFSRRRRATLNRISVRLPGARSRQPDSHACCADSTAALTSLTSAAATSANASSVAGLINVVRRPEAESRYAPLTNHWIGNFWGPGAFITVLLRTTSAYPQQLLAPHWSCDTDHQSPERPGHRVGRALRRD